MDSTIADDPSKNFIIISKMEILRMLPKPPHQEFADSFNSMKDPVIANRIGTDTFQVNLPNGMNLVVTISRLSDQDPFSRMKKEFLNGLYASKTPNPELIQAVQDERGLKAITPCGNGRYRADFEDGRSITATINSPDPFEDDAPTFLPEWQSHDEEPVPSSSKLPSEDEPESPGSPILDVDEGKFERQRTINELLFKCMISGG